MLTDTRDVPVHFSELKRMQLSPAHCKVAMLTPREVNPKAAHLRHGQALNLLLDGSRAYAIWRGKVKNGKVWDAFAEENADRLILTPEEFNAADCAAQAIAHKPEAMKRLDGERQKSIEWKWLGRQCASTLDVIRKGEFITELKTARSAHPDRFLFAANRYGYHAQHAFYALAARYAGLGEHEHSIIVSESEPPWDVTIIRLTARRLELGERMCRMWMERLLACEAAGEFPGYTQTIVEWDVDDDAALVFDGDGDEDEAAQ